jgi:hypothetical protein
MQISQYKTTWITHLWLPFNMHIVLPGSTETTSKLPYSIIILSLTSPEALPLPLLLLTVPQRYIH